MRKTLTGGAAALTALAIAAPAQAAAVDVGSGATTLRLDAGTARVLTGAGFDVAPIGPAKAGRAGVAFPITGGRVDDATARGSIRHSGGLRFRRGETTVRLTSFTVNVRRGVSTLSARVNGGVRATVIRLGLSDARVRKDGGALVVSRVTANLSRTGAGALNKAFSVRVFRPGLRLGTVTVRATPA